MHALLLAALLASPGSAEAPGLALASLEGEILFPACDGPPEDLEVCAEGSSGNLYCTGPRAIDGERIGYRLDVPAGDYRVFSRSEEVAPGHRAYYTEAVRCGLGTRCRNHAPITVKAIAGQSTTDVHPADWNVSEPTLLLSLAE